MKGGSRKKSAESLPNRETYQRLNFLHQASQVLATTPGSAQHKLSTFYSKSFKRLAQKHVLRLSPQIKRTLCRGCDGIMVPGLTADVQRLTQPNRQELTRTVCETCGSYRQYPISVPSRPLFEDRARTMSDINGEHVPVPPSAAKTYASSATLAAEKTVAQPTAPSHPTTA
ncbi:hypothetical protein CXG81DRAFT_28278 [Caulochytrium protostelioides]|uniref:Rpr2-domain-containing protein n=1 Tax=Caulochytrium protostelioides TaxID=1555241 RepID=A0A4V1IU10_9FUNG|nr:hypothetical protein CXG81DRAFT_28278 [Caulochytrium protostelioides]|eukprot:RKO98927.1 hypothetical protein CXG81DRAFT_28278 [Caulochytrium protostelioides]